MKKQLVEAGLYKEQDTDSNTVTDIDNHIYRTVTIGSQVWMAENLKVTRYADGTTIPHITDDIEWIDIEILHFGRAYCYYDNDIGLDYGVLYSYATAIGLNAQGICPNGWHLPSDEEWTELENKLRTILSILTEL